MPGEQVQGAMCSVFMSQMHCINVSRSAPHHSTQNLRPLSRAGRKVLGTLLGWRKGPVP